MEEDRSEHGADTETTPQLSSRAWARLFRAPRRIAGRFLREVVRQDLLDQAATLAFWFLLSFFPLLLALLGTFGWLLEERIHLKDSLLTWLDEIVPDDMVARLVSRVLEDLQESSQGTLVIGLLVTLWAGSNTLNQIQRAVDRGDEQWLAEAGLLVRWRRRLAALPLTILVATPLVAAIALHFYGGLIAQAITAQFELDRAFEMIWPWIRWITLVLALLTSFDLAFNTAPSRWGSRNHWLSPGAVLALGLWILASEGLRVWVKAALTRSPSYGSLGGAVLLLLWFYVSAIAILAGIRLNQILEEPLEATPAAEDGSDPENGGAQKA